MRQRWSFDLFRVAEPNFVSVGAKYKHMRFGYPNYHSGSGCRTLADPSRILRTAVWIHSDCWGLRLAEEAPNGGAVAGFSNQSQRRWSVAGPRGWEIACHCHGNGIVRCVSIKSVGMCDLEWGTMVTMTTPSQLVLFIYYQWYHPRVSSIDST